MSFSQAANKAMNEVVLQFLKSASQKFNVNENELVQLWNGESVNTTLSTSSETSSSIPASTIAPSSELSKLGKNELVAHCKTRGLKSTGTKQELIDRLTGGAVVSSDSTEKKEEKKPNQMEVYLYLFGSSKSHQLVWQVVYRLL